MAITLLPKGGEPLPGDGGEVCHTGAGRQEARCSLCRLLSVPRKQTRDRREPVATGDSSPAAVCPPSWTRAVRHAEHQLGHGHRVARDVQAFGAAERVEQHTASIRRLNELRAGLPELIVLPAHDHTAYQSEHLGPGLAEGHLTAEERARIRRYEQRVFTADGRLRADRMPRYIACGGPDPLGGVSE